MEREKCWQILKTLKTDFSPNICKYFRRKVSGRGTFVWLYNNNGLGILSPVQFLRASKVLDDLNNAAFEHSKKVRK